jgi:hypothetical protein
MIHEKGIFRYLYELKQVREELETTCIGTFFLLDLLSSGRLL